MVRWRSGYATVCKTVLREFESPSHLIIDDYYYATVCLAKRDLAPPDKTVLREFESPSHLIIDDYYYATVCLAKRDLAPPDKTVNRSSILLPA